MTDEWSVETWTTVVRVMADCLSCGEEGPEGLAAERAAARRWARQHAEKHPGHHAVVETSSARSYRNRTPVEDRGGEDRG